MEKIKNFITNLFSMGNLITGFIGMSFGYMFVLLIRAFVMGTFGEFGIFIATSVGFILCTFMLGYIMNKTLFKDDL